MKLANLFPVIICAMMGLSVQAQELVEFQAGQPAVAEDVNQNFADIVTRMDDLQDQINAMSAAQTMESIAGTYDVFELGTELFSNGTGNYNVAGFTINTTLILNANGTGSVQSSEGLRELNINTSGQGGDESTTFALPDDNSSDPSPIDLTWTLNGNTLTLTILGDDGDVIPVTVAAGGKTLVTTFGAGGQSDGEFSLIVGIKRPTPLF